MSEYDEAGAETPEEEPPQHPQSEPEQESTVSEGFAEAPDSEPRAAATGDIEPEVTPRNAVERLDGRVVTYWLLSGLVSLLIMLGIGIGALTLFWEEIPFEASVKYGVAFGIGGIMLAWTVIAPPLAFARWRFQITLELLLARYGIIFHEEKAIPISRLQHVDLTRGPIERMFGLATLVVFTAGTEGASFRLPGLAVARAEQLRDQILETRGDDVI